PKLAKIMSRQKRDRDRGTDDAALDVAAAEAKLTELDDMLGDGELTRASYLRARKKPEAKLADARARLSRKNGTHALERFRGRKHPADLYRKLDTDERRAVISSLLDRIVIHEATSRAPKLDTERVDPIWRV